MLMPRDFRPVLVARRYGQQAMPSNMIRYFSSPRKVETPFLWLSSYSFSRVSMASAAVDLPRAVTMTAMWFSRSKPLKGEGTYLAQPVAASHARLERQLKPVTSLNFSSDHFLPVSSSSCFTASQNWPVT